MEVICSLFISLGVARPEITQMSSFIDFRGGPSYKTDP
jgi:hypothetical protein